MSLLISKKSWHYSIIHRYLDITPEFYCSDLCAYVRKLLLAMSLMLLYATIVTGLGVSVVDFFAWLIVSCMFNIWAWPAGIGLLFLIILTGVTTFTILACIAFGGKKIMDKYKEQKRQLQSGTIKKTTIAMSAIGLTLHYVHSISNKFCKMVDYVEE